VNQLSNGFGVVETVRSVDQWSQSGQCATISIRRSWSTARLTSASESGVVLQVRKRAVRDFCFLVAVQAIMGSMPSVSAMQALLAELTEDFARRSADSVGGQHLGRREGVGRLTP